MNPLHTLAPYLAKIYKNLKQNQKEGEWRDNKGRKDRNAGRNKERMKGREIGMEERLIEVNPCSWQLPLCLPSSGFLKV
jgi:hypothetical protein